MRTRLQTIIDKNGGYYTNWFISGVNKSKIPTNVIDRQLLDRLSSLWSDHSTKVVREEWHEYIDKHLLPKLGIELILIGGE